MCWSGEGLHTLLFLSNIKRKRMKGACLPGHWFHVCCWLSCGRGCRAHHRPLAYQGSGLLPPAPRPPEAAPLPGSASSGSRQHRPPSPWRCSLWSHLPWEERLLVMFIQHAQLVSEPLVCPHFLGLKPKQTVNKKPILETGVCAGHEEWHPGEKHLCSWLSAKKRLWCFWPTVPLWDTC